MIHRRSWIFAASAIGWAAGGPVGAQVLAHGSDMPISYGRVAAALLLCLALAAGAALALRGRLGVAAKPPSLMDWRGWAAALRRPTRSFRLELVERLRVSPQLEVSLIRCEGRRYLVASSPTGTVLLDKDLPAGGDGEGGP